MLLHRKRRVQRVQTALYSFKTPRSDFYLVLCQKKDKSELSYMFADLSNINLKESCFPDWKFYLWCFSLKIEETCVLLKSIAL